jgi:hypothetical protein
MGGLLQSKVSMDVNFVIAKDVLAAKYKVSYSVSCPGRWKLFVI